MKFDTICDYVTPPEIAERWQLRPDSWMLHRAILRGVLKPCIFVSGVDMVRMEIDAQGKAVPGMDGDTPVIERVSGWLYPWHEFKEQTGPFDAVFPIVSDVCELVEGSRLHLLDKPIDLASVLENGCVMMPDLLNAEQVLCSHEATTKEMNKQLCIISTLAAMYCKYDPEKRDGLAGQISEESKRFGIYVSDGTARKWLRRAMDEFPPSYLATSRGESAQTPTSDEPEPGERRAPYEPERLAA